MKPTRGAGDRWLAGEAVPGVHFALHDAVDVIAGALDGQHGIIELLMSLTPEPRYLVTLSTGVQARVQQAMLRHRAAT